MTNTEKPTTKQEQKKQGTVEKPRKTDQKPIAQKLEQKKDLKSEKKITEKKKKPEKPKVKKTEAVINSQNLHISTKKSIALCKFIKHKSIKDAIANLEQVLQLKKAVPMKGELPHQKGIMSGGFPKKATEHFILLLKNLLANANANELENPVIVEAVANIGARPFGGFGRIRRKRTHLKIKVKEKKSKKK